MSYTSIRVSTGNASIGTPVGFEYPSILGFLEKDKIYTLQFKIRSLNNTKILDEILVGSQKLDVITITDFEECKLDEDITGYLCYITFTSKVNIKNPKIRIARNINETDVSNTDIFEVTDISLAYGRLAAYDSNVGDFKYLKENINTRIQQLANSIVLSAAKEDIDYLSGKISEALGQIQVAAGKITLMVKEGELSSLIEQLPNSVKIAFNGISSEWKFDENKFTNTVNGKTGLSLGNGRLNVNRFTDGKPVGYYGQSFSGSQQYWGNVISGTYNSYYTAIGFNPNVVNDGDSTSTGFEHFMTYVFYPFGSAYPNPGIYVQKPMYIQDHIDINATATLHQNISLNNNNSIRFGSITNALYQVSANIYTSSKQELEIIPGSNTYGGLIVNGAGYFHPTKEGGAYTLGKTTHPFYRLYSTTTYSNNNIVYNPGIKTKSITNNNDVLDSIEFISSYEKSNDIVMDITKIANTNYVEVDEENNAYINNSEMIKLLIKEVKNLKEEIRTLKSK